MSQLETFDQIT